MNNKEKELVNEELVKDKNVIYVVGDKFPNKNVKNLGNLKRKVLLKATKLLSLFLKKKVMNILQKKFLKLLQLLKTKQKKQVCLTAY